ncbi:MAG: dolichol-phosphate mannosyltransferase [Nitrososphaera sp.]
MPLSIILPTYNESENIAGMMDSIVEALPDGIHAEIIVVDDNSPDGTADIAQEHAGKLASSSNSIGDNNTGAGKHIKVQVIRRPGKLGLSSAILAGAQQAQGEAIVVMDSDMSHPPQTIPYMLDELERFDIVVASRYVEGGAVTGWPFKRKIVSKGATKIARYSLGINIKDPMSGFFAFKRHVIQGIKFDAIGYKMLLEMLVKAKGARVKEIPYTFINRRLGSSKLDSKVMVDYAKAVWRLYRYGRTSVPAEKRTSVRFFSKAGRFYTVGASGLLVNYLASFVLGMLVPGVWYLHATIFGILFSITSNFVLNKLWTFEDRDFAFRKTVAQYGLFAGFSAFGALVQLSILYWLVESQSVSYPLALVAAVATASIGNFLLNKKWTFKEKVWS